ncbi:MULTISPECIES: hypothetical protein [unclassified Aeromonas]|uniref:hypothetical protein n=1 Tax=unclassified Aeromonas TaxID=257493 RepID=UPI0022E6AD37|nr:MULTISPECIES: hypothetical protein [unclassified Aeromonas]
MLRLQRGGDLKMGNCFHGIFSLVTAFIGFYLIIFIDASIGSAFSAFSIGYSLRDLFELGGGRSWHQ